LERSDRRRFLVGAAGLAAAAAGYAGGGTAAAAARADDPAKEAARLAGVMPGPFRGRVAQVDHPGAVVDGAINREAVREMMDRGMRALTGEKDLASAWRRLFGKGDVVGVKVNPVGQPLAISQPAVVLEIIEGLKSAGVPAKDVIVFDRYRDQFLEAGYRDILPPDVRWDAAAARFDGVQLGIEGYDPDVFIDLPLIGKGIHQPDDPRARRSHVVRIVTQKVTKIINVPVLKDHGTGGVTLALKNMSHGLVNNVARSHADEEMNACGQFIPAVVAFPPIRGKVVLHILDGLRAVYERGPGASPRYVWEQKSLFFATDPVAVDRVGWEIVDAKRKEKGLPPVGKSTWQGNAWRQPEHIHFAAALGLGESDLGRIERTKIALG
jgi:hypothetical protein